jgi:hypothetical protein
VAVGITESAEEKLESCRTHAGHRHWIIVVEVIQKLLDVWEIHIGERTTATGAVGVPTALVHQIRILFVSVEEVASHVHTERYRRVRRNRE